MKIEPAAFRPGFAVVLVLVLVGLAGYAILPTLTDQVSAAMERRQARTAQLAVARGTVAQRAELASQVQQLERVVDEGMLFHRGPNAAMVQGTVEATIRAAMQGGGLAIRGLETRTETIGGTRRRLTTRLTADGLPEAVNAALTQLETAHPRLLIQEIHLRPATVSANGSQALTLDLEIDAYADVAAP